MPIAIANRYARALADVLGRAGDYQAILRELDDFSAAYRQSPDLRDLFETPTVPPAEKTKVLDAILTRLAVSPVTRNFLRVLLANYRMKLLEEVNQAFRQIANARRGIVEVKVFSADQVSEAERRTLRARFEALTRRKVELEFHIDRRLLGGIVAQVGSTVYDGSIRGQLDRIREQATAR